MTPFRSAEAAAPQSRARARLCSQANAHRVASRMFEASRRAVRVVRTGDAARPYRVLAAGEAIDGDVELEIRFI